MVGKRGQFYLIAAIVIIALIIGFAVVSSTPKKTTPIKLYDLGQELGIESQNVLAYGTYNELNDSQMQALWVQFVQEYASYTGEGKNLYFVFGNSATISVIAYQSLNESASVDVGTGYQKLIINSGQPQSFVPSGSTVTIKIGDQKYQFNLQTGQNFYFVISQTVEGEKYVVTSP
ncbi:MAG TPA: hypothetical protein VMC80_01585 [Patescibacteria group bacterium]|nr:hypothetical protein [Patescibacteria group bacterium]